MYVLIDYGRTYLFTSTCPSLLLKSPLSLVKYPSFNMFNRLANELRPYSAGHFFGNSFGFVLETCPKCPPHWMTIMGKRMLGVLLPIAAGVKQIKGFLLLLMETTTAKNGGLSFIGNGELSMNFLKPRKKIWPLPCHSIWFLTLSGILGSKIGYCLAFLLIWFILMDATCKIIRWWSNSCMKCKCSCYTKQQKPSCCYYVKINVHHSYTVTLW